MMRAAVKSTIRVCPDLATDIESVENALRGGEKQTISDSIC